MTFSSCFIYILAGDTIKVKLFTKHSCIIQISRSLCLQRERVFVSKPLTSVNNPQVINLVMQCSECLTIFFGTEWAFEAILEILLSVLSLCYFRSGWKVVTNLVIGVLLHIRLIFITNSVGYYISGDAAALKLTLSAEIIHFQHPKEWKCRKKT